MKLGDVIRKYRKEKQLTQEAMADFLGVSTPAVNKWEKGISYPDITLLAPIARLFGISTDTLLLYKEELAPQEITQIIHELNDKLRRDGYAAAFQWGLERIREYPNCESLLLSAVQLLDGSRGFYHVEDSSAYDAEIQKLYERVLNSRELDIRYAAATALFLMNIKQENYDKSWEYLDTLPKQNAHRERYQALFYAVKGDTQKAYEAYEGMLLSLNSDLSYALHGLTSLSLKEDDLVRAEMMIEKQKALADILEYGEYQKASCELELALMKKDATLCFQALELLINNAGSIASFRSSELYRHMTFSGNFDVKNIYTMLREALTADDEVDFLKSDPRYEEMLEFLGNALEE